MSINTKYTECIYNENGREIRHTTSDGVINFDGEKPVYTQSVKLEEKVYNDNGLGYVQKWKYDDRFTETHKMTSYENSHGEWNKITYDDNGRKLTYADSNGYFEKYTYNTLGCTLTYKNGDGYWEENTYNDYAQRLSHKDSTGLFETYMYTPSGTKLVLLHQTDDYFEEWQYDTKFQVIKHINTLYDFCEEFIYDNCGNRHTTYYTSKENIKSPEKWTYTSDGNILTYKNAHEYNEYTYNKAGKIISHKLYEF